MDPVDCPINSCSAHWSNSDNHCDSNDLNSGKVLFETNSRKVTAVKNIDDGYTRIICIKCINEYVERTITNWQIT